VRTLCGNGEQGGDRQDHGPAAKAQLNSPWDCLLVGKQLYLAMAGHHQIWRYDPATGEIGVFAGTGREACLNGVHAAAAFAQPSGLASDGQRLYVADSETSSIRAVDLDPTGETRTIAGSEDLFGFGLVDGNGRDARFQHPIGICLTGTAGHALLVVSDTYNHVLRSVDPLTGEVKTLAGSGKAGRGSADRIGFFEPHGVAALDGTLYVADTNQHRIVVLEGGKARELAVTLPK
jgi:sugar lactone lactonase YvrE